VAPDRSVVESLQADQLLWVDLGHRNSEVVEQLGTTFDLHPGTVRALGERYTRAALHRFDNYIHLTLQAVEEDAGRTVQHEIDIVAGRNWVITVHEAKVAAFEAFLDQIRGDTRIGKLDAAAFMAALVDSQLSSYFGVVEGIEQEIDRLDERALRSADRDLLGDFVRLRRRVAILRRTLAPHREAFAPLARPDFELHEDIGSIWPGLVERLERTLEAVENVRDLLVGSFDIHMGRLAQRTNEVMKVLTIVSSVLLPSVVLAGIMGMNFKLGFFEDPANFWLVIAAMLAMALTILGVAHWRRWI
jgi:magnesium/cobalt transport protein CorA